MSKHLQKVEEPPKIRTKLTPVVSDGVSVDEPRGKGSSLQVIQPDTYSSSSSRSHSPTRTDSTSGSRPTSGTQRKNFDEINKIKTNTAKDENRTAGEDRAGTPSSVRSLSNRRKTPSFSSDSSESDIERRGQRSNGPRHRRGYLPSNRTKEHNGNSAVARPSMPTNEFDKESRAKKTVSWRESPRTNTSMDVNRQISNERPRIPPKPPVRTVSRDNGTIRTLSRDSSAAKTLIRDSGAERTMLRDSVAESKKLRDMLRESGAERTVLRDSGAERTVLRDSGAERTVFAERTVLRDSGTAVRTVLRDIGTVDYVQLPRDSSRDGANRSVDIFVVPSVKVQQPVKPIEENSGTPGLSYSFNGYQQEDRPWYETDEFD